MTTITINSARPVAKGPKYIVVVHVDNGTGFVSHKHLTYTSFRLLLVLAIRALRGPQPWVSISELANHLSSDYLYRLKKDLEIHAIENFGTKEYRWNTKRIAIKITPRAWKELETFPDAFIRGFMRERNEIEKITP
jgi:hypothetical protein